MLLRGYRKKGTEKGGWGAPILLPTPVPKNESEKAFFFRSILLPAALFYVHACAG